MPYDAARPALPPVYRLQLVRESPARGQRISIDEAADAAKVFAELLADCDREHLLVMTLAVKNQVIGVTTVSVGTLNASLVRPADVFKPAILSNAASVIVAHNHPSGDPTPSPEDLDVTKRLREAGSLLDVVVLDHIVIGDGGSYRSIQGLV